ncbi:PREDICTED: ral guanine nucleotide dissociation stimulator-like 3 [Mandrillus leucophaeus]|uniref:ral guanine nucleotide dissociation stimulator-like 3 n=1 Tax=Mandrillus leucophaeus TaxID=9568 RepID=UPI0005F53C86|nr:PREDICTED: ral guanine nucleotide dissociation stimulator-like 3 [Mandrillus leucophaeus]
MERTAGKELALAPLQDWGEETEDGAVYSVSLRRQRSQRLSPAEGTGGSQAPSPIANTFLHYRTSKVRVLRAARLERLVGELVSGDREQDPSFVPAFLATYRTFVPTAHLLGFLLPPMPPPPPPGVEIKKTAVQDLSFNKNLRWVLHLDRGVLGGKSQRSKGLTCVPTAWQRCRELRNFSSLRAILSALQSNPIYRLKRSWGAVSREPLSTFRKLSQIFSDENNHLSSREILFQEEATEGSQKVDNTPGSLPSKPPPGPVPYLGTFLTDLVMLDTALPDMLEGDLINFEKRRKEWEILARIQQLQRRCQSYTLSPHPPILAALHAQRQLSEEQSYRLSWVIEPPAASCPSSPRIQRRISLTKRLSAKLSREKSSFPSWSPGNPSSPTSSVSPGSPPSSPRSRDAPAGSPPASPGPQGPSTKLPLSPDLPRPGPLPLGSPRIPLPAQQSSEARVIRISIDNDHGNLYRSILLTSQDKAPSVVQRALQKHNVPQPWARDYQLFQVLPGDRELLIPDNANVFYAMSPAAPGDFMLRRKEGTRHTLSVSPT